MPDTVAPKRVIQNHNKVEPGSISWVKHVLVGQWGITYAEALQFFCQKAFPDAAVATGCSGSEILASLYSQRADLLLLSLDLPDVHGLDLLKRVISERLATRVLIACHHGDERTIMGLRDAQFDGLIDTEEEHVKSLIEALQLVASGQPYVSPVFRHSIIDRSPVGEVWQKLTPAEMRVFAAIGDGSGNYEAAQQLGLSEATVQTHRRNLMHKLEICCSAKLVREAIRLGVVQINTDGKVIRLGFVPQPARNGILGTQPAEV